MIRDLTIEYRKNPIGIDEKPRFSWKLESESRMLCRQTTRFRLSAEAGLCGTAAG